MPFWLMFLLFVGSIIIGELLKPKPQFTNAKPAGLGDFTFPTAQEGRPIPVVWGTAKIMGPNLVWYGNLATVPIIEEIKYKKMFQSKTKKVIKGHRYFIDMHFGVCHGPIDAIAVGIQDRAIAPKTSISPGGTTLAVTDPGFFGGEDRGGGIGGTIIVHAGNETDAVDAELAGKIAQVSVPGFRRVCTVFATGPTFTFDTGGEGIFAFFNKGTAAGFEIGNDEFVEPWFFEVTRIPTGLGSATPIIVNDFGREDANPAEVIFELLTEHTWGAGIAEGLIDKPSFLAAAVTLATEGFGVSLQWDQKKTVEDMLLEIVRQIDSVLFNDLVTGLFTLKLIRDDFDPNLIPTLDQTNVSDMRQYSRPSLDETTNEVKVVFTGENFKPQDAQAHELANFNTQSENFVSTTFQYPGINDSNIAAQVAFRELRTTSSPLARATLKTNREAFDLRPGDAFKFTWAPLGIIDLVMRVNGVKYGTLDQGFIEIDAVEDIFKLSNTIWGTPQSTDWEEPINPPVDAPFQDAFSAPFHLVRQEFADFGFLSEESNMLATVAGEPTPDTFGYAVLTRTPPAGFITTGETDALTPTGTLTVEYTATPDTGHLDLSNTLEVTPDSRMGLLSVANITEVLQNNFNLVFVGDIDAQSGEILAFEEVEVSPSGTTILFNRVHRGLMDTTPKTHPIGTRIWFVFFGMGTSETTEYGDTESIEAKYLMKTLAGTLDEGSASVNLHTFTSRTQRPYPPGNFLIEGEIFPEATDGNEAENAELNLTWAHRDRIFSLFNVDQGDPTQIGPEALVDYQLRIRDEGDFLIRTEDFSPGSATTAFDYRCDVEAADSSITVDPINNQALRWQGASQEAVTFPNATVLNTDAAGYDQKTFEFKIRTSSDVTSRQNIWEQGDEIDGFGMYILNGELRAGAWSDNATTSFSEFSNPVAILANTKYNFAFVFDNTNSRIRLYINGILVDERTGLTLDTMPAHGTGATEQPQLGRRNRTRYHDVSSTNIGAQLRVDALAFEVRQWNVARTTAEIDTNQNANLVGNETNLVGLWEISDGTGTTVTDETANNNDGTRIGTALPAWVCPDLVLNATLDLELDSRFTSGGLISHQFQDRRVTRSGWGYAWGDFWGGSP